MFSFLRKQIKKKNNLQMSEYSPKNQIIVGQSNEQIHLVLTLPISLQLDHFTKERPFVMRRGSILVHLCSTSSIVIQ